MRRRQFISLMVGAATAWPRVARAQRSAVNIKTFGAVGDGVTDDSRAFSNFAAYARAQKTPVYLVIPPGTYNTPSIQSWWYGIANLTVYGYGAILLNWGVGGPFSQAAPGVASARIVSTNIGDRSVTLITPSQASIFAVGNWVNINSVEMQGQNGYPPNWYNHEYHQITGIRGGVISLDTPMRSRPPACHHALPCLRPCRHWPRFPERMPLESEALGCCSISKIRFS